MKKNFFILISLLVPIAIFVQCGDSDRSLPAGSPMKVIGLDTSGNGQNDAFGYYLTTKGNRRVVYQEIDKNGDRRSDEFIWVGSTGRRPSNGILQEAVKVYEESDENNDGIIETIRWYLPNEYISMVFKDSDKDSYFETTQYYNFQKKPVRTEIDTNKDGFADIYIWSTRAEIDSDFDKIPDMIVLGNSPLELEDKAINRRETKTLVKTNSWFLNAKLIPETDRAIIGSGLTVD
jgi:hypothetical protein